MVQCSHRCERHIASYEYNPVHHKMVPKPIVPTRPCMIHRLTQPGIRGVFSKMVEKLLDADPKWYATLARETECAMLPEDSDSVTVLDEDTGTMVLTKWRYTRTPTLPALKPPTAQ